MKSQPTKIHTLLATVKVSQMPLTKGKVVEVASSDSLEAGFQKLVDNNILSAPVYDEATKKYTGFLDVRDLVSCVVFIADQSADVETKTLADLFVNAKWVGGTYSVTYLSRRNAFKPVAEDASLYDVLELLTGSKSKLKRIPVVNAAGRVVNVISQSTMVQFVHSHLGKLLPAARAKKTIKELDLGTSPVKGIEDSTPALEALRLMDEHSISGLVLTKEGRMVGNISARDLKAFVRQIDFEQLVLPVGEFIKNLRNSDIVDIRTPTIGCFETDTLGYTVEKLAATKVHRLWITDDEEHYRPIRVVSLYDVLHELMREV